MSNKYWYCGLVSIATTYDTSMPQWVSVCVQAATLPIQLSGNDPAEAPKDGTSVGVPASSGEIQRKLQAPDSSLF